MKALRLHRAGDLRLEDEPVPAADDDHVLLRVEAVGLCGSDRHWYLEGAIGDAALAHPLVLGHEFVATIVSGPRSGERVAVDPSDPCGRCAPCLGGLGHLCLDPRFAGHGAQDGALRELMSWRPELAHPIPDSIGNADGTLLEPLGVALHAIDLGHIAEGTTTAVFGCGPIGLLLIRTLRAAGAHVAAFDPLGHRLSAAYAGGATEVGPAVDVAFEVAGTDEALGAAIEAARPGGRVVIVGIPDDDRTTFAASNARRKGLTLLLSRRMTAADLPRAIELVATGAISLAGLVTEEHDLDAATTAFEGLVERRGLKIVVTPGSARATG